MSIVALYASLLALWFIYLSYMVVKHRRNQRVDIGQGEGPLARHVRAQANFSEYVPIALILLCLLAWSNVEPWLLHLLGAALLAGRILHPLGFVAKPGANFGRVYGTLLTWLVIVVAALVNLYLLNVKTSF